MLVNDTKIIFFGKTNFSYPSIKKLLENGYNLTVIDKKDGSLKDDEFFEYFKSLNPTLCIVADYGRIIPSKYLEFPKYGFINIHPSLLPKYRGPSPVQTAILNGDPALQRADAFGKTNRSLSDGASTKTGVTIILIDEQIDHGPILAQKTYNLQPTTYYTQAEKDLAELGAELLIETLPKYISGKIRPKEQDHSKVTFTKMFSRIDGRISWNEPAEKIYNQIRALNPEPGTWTTWHGKVINISNVTTSDVVSPQVPGTVKKNGDDIAIATQTCYLVLKQIQLESRRKTDAKSFVNGHPDFIGSVLE